MNKRLIFFILITLLSTSALAVDCDVERARRLMAQYNEMLAKGDYDGIKRIRKERESLLPGNCFPSPKFDNGNRNNKNINEIITNNSINNRCAFEYDRNFCGASSDIRKRKISVGTDEEFPMPNIDVFINKLTEKLINTKMSFLGSPKIGIYFDGSLTEGEQCCEDCSITTPVDFKKIEFSCSVNLAAQITVPSQSINYKQTFFKGLQIEVTGFYGPRLKLEFSSNTSSFWTISECKKKDSCLSLNFPYSKLDISGEAGFSGEAKITYKNIKASYEDSEISSYYRDIVKYEESKSVDSEIGAKLEAILGISGSGKLGGLSLELGNNCKGLQCQSGSIGPINVYGDLITKLNTGFFQFSYKKIVSIELMNEKQIPCT